MVTPSREKIREKALAMYQQENYIISDIIPEDYELKEGSYWKRAQIALMGSRVDNDLAMIPRPEMRAQQERYVMDMAEELDLRVIPHRDLRVLKRKTGFEWTNGWTEHKKPTRVPIPPKPKKAKLKRVKKRKRKAAKKPTRKPKPTPPVIRRVSLRKPLDIGAAIRGKAKPLPKPKREYGKCPYCGLRVLLTERGLVPTQHIQSAICQNRRKKLRDQAVTLGVIHQVVMKERRKPKKRKKRHVDRAGKTMKKLREPIKDGKRVFAFPDHVWRVRKVGKKA